MLIQLHKNGGILLSHLTDTFKSLMRWIDTRALILLLMPKSVLWSLEMVIERPDGMLTIRCLRSIPLKAGFRRSFNDHDCSGTASQITPQGRHQHANATGGKGRVWTGDRRHPVLCLCKLEKDVPTQAEDGKFQKDETNYAAVGIAFFPIVLGCFGGIGYRTARFLCTLAFLELRQLDAIRAFAGLA